MSRKKKLQPFESVRREIARRLQAGLPLAGMIAATTLLTGCHEHSENFPAGSVPRDPALYERQSEKPKTPDQPKPKNQDNETVTAGGVGPVMGALIPPPNKKNETVDPASTVGRYPARPENK